MLGWLLSLPALAADPLSALDGASADLPASLQGQLPSFAACAPHAASSGDRGAVPLSLFIAPSGAALVLSASASTAESPLEACIRERAAALRFPAQAREGLLWLTATLSFSDASSPPTLQDARLQGDQADLRGAPSESAPSAAGGLSGLGSGGTAEALGGLGASGLGSGSRGYGRGSGSLRDPGQVAQVRIDGAPTIQGVLDRALVDAVIKRHMSQIRYCYERELVKDPTLSGDVTIELVIAPNGAVPSARVKATTMADPAVGDCVASRFRRMEFPAPMDGVALAAYRFAFTPPAAP